MTGCTRTVRALSKTTLSLSQLLYCISNDKTLHGVLSHTHTSQQLYMDAVVSGMPQHLSRCEAIR
jgi:hypothetical protein